MKKRTKLHSFPVIIERDEDGYYIGTSNIFTDYRTDKTCTTDTDCRAVELCRKETGTSQFFGLLKDKTCTTGYFQFKNHVYTCNATLNKDNFFAACPVSGDYPNGCCVFTPRVRVKDNWGWCNGSCADTATIKHPNGGCYDASWMEDSLGRPTGVDECYTMGFNKDLPHWTNFGGKVIVAP